MRLLGQAPRLRNRRETTCILVTAIVAALATACSSDPYDIR